MSKKPDHRSNTNYLLTLKKSKTSCPFEPKYGRIPRVSFSLEKALSALYHMAKSVITKVNTVRTNFEKDLREAKKTAVNDESTFDDLYVRYFSKKNGVITNLIKLLPELSITEKKEIGPLINSLQGYIKTQLELFKQEIKQNKTHEDLTYLLAPKATGTLHPTTQVIRELNEFFRYYGYSVYEGPEIENPEFNFRKLNLPEGHPATDLQDTLFIKEPNLLLRTHTSSVEARALTLIKPPMRFAFAGKVFRNETINATNGAFFHHYQGFVVDKGITMQHLKGTMELLHKFLFGNDIELRFRYKFYPEVSPGMGVDIKCKFCNGRGCTVCKQRGWIEGLGSGMIHYNTLKACGIDPEVYTGFAFGIGLDRFVMLRFGIPDIRKLYGGGLVYY